MHHILSKKILQWSIIKVIIKHNVQCTPPPTSQTRVPSLAQSRELGQAEAVCFGPAQSS